MAETTTPSGITIEFTPPPKRAYFLSSDTYMKAEVPSVTTILRILDKPALKWWAMKQGVGGFIELIDRYAWRQDGLPDTLSTDKVVKWLAREQLTINHTSKNAAKRGQGAHDALERFITTGEIPDPREFPLPDRGFVKGLTDWLEVAKPDLELAEFMVGSVEHGFAGRTDLLAWIGQPQTLWLIDLKTSAKARVYDEALMQLAGYEACLEECGYPMPDRKAIVCVGADGSYVVKESHARPEHFLCILAAYRAVDEVKLIHSAKAAA